MRRLFTFAFVVASIASPARAEMVRFRFIPTDACGTTQQVAAGPNGAIGERSNSFGFAREPYYQAFRPTHMVTFLHPYLQRNVTVPLTLPDGTPQHEHRSDRIIYNYGSYVVEARFHPDGSIETVYNSGLMRALQVR